MKINIKEEGNQVLVALVGRLDTVASTEMASEFQKITEMAHRTIILDCSELEYIASSGLRMFLSIRKSAQALGGNVVVRNINEEIRNVFSITGFTNLFTIE